MDLELQAAVRTLAVASRGLERSADELTLSQYRVLILVSSAPDRASRVAERALVSRPSLTGVLDALEVKGYLRRVQVAGDRRGVRLELTAAGGLALARADRSMTEWLGAVLDDGPPHCRRDVTAGLVALGEALTCHHRHAHESSVPAGDQ
jgi:DNA-binding MarR family transcriptional regulator